MGMINHDSLFLTAASPPSVTGFQAPDLRSHPAKNRGKIHTILSYTETSPGEVEITGRQTEK
jgi:hypothetical protein